MKKKISLPLYLSLLLTLIPGGLFIRYAGVVNYETGGISKKVAAFYYPWYSNTTDYSQSAPYPIDDDATWRHWDGPGWEPPTNVCSTNTPLWGWYDSADPAIIQTHLGQAEWAGIDAFVVSYWGAGGPDFYNFQAALRVAKNVTSPIKFAPYFEIFGSMVDRTDDASITQSLLQEFLQLHDILTDIEFRDNVWVEQGKPVLFIYVMKDIPSAIWLTVQNGLEAAGKEFFLVGDRPARGSDDYAVISAAHQYDVYAPLRDNSYTRDFLTIKWDCRRAGTLFAAGVSPGYDDLVVRDGNLPRDREGGETYTMTWELALSLHPDWITITSWNEWHEGTEIEPSVEHGDLALNQTRAYIQEFKSGHHSTLTIGNPLRPQYTHLTIFIALVWAVAGTCTVSKVRKRFGTIAFSPRLSYLYWIFAGGYLIFTLWSLIGSYLALNAFYSLFSGKIYFFLLGNLLFFMKRPG